MARRKRWDIKAILADPVLRKELMIRSIISTQALEGIVTTREQAEQAYEYAIGRSNRESK